MLSSINGKQVINQEWLNLLLFHIIIDVHIEKINADTKLDEEQKNLYSRTRETKNSVLSNIKFIDPEFNVEYFKEN